MEEAKIKIMIVDDMEAHRRRFYRLLSGQEDMTVAAQAATGQEAVETALGVKPDIILMDIEMESNKAGIIAATQILEHLPHTKIIMLTVHRDDEMVFQAYQAGTEDYILKSEAPEVVLQGIRTAFNSVSPIRGDIAASIRTEFKRIKETEHSLLYVLSVLPTLTYSELQVLKLLCQHKTKREIAEERVVEFSTVKKQVSSIIKKFGKTSAAEVAEVLMQINIIDLLR